jgi:hypothetical protein
LRTSTGSPSHPARNNTPVFSPSPKAPAAATSATMVFGRPRPGQKPAVPVRDALKVLRLRPGPSVRVRLVLFTEGQANPDRRPFFDHQLVWLVRVVKPQCFGGFHGQCQQPHNAIVDAKTGLVLLLYST